MRLPLDVGRAGLNLMMFVFVLAAMILFRLSDRRASS